MACEDGQIQTHKIIISHSIPVLKNEENNIDCSIIFKMRNLLIKTFITYLVSSHLYILFLNRIYHKKVSQLYWLRNIMIKFFKNLYPSFIIIFNTITL